MCRVTWRLGIVGAVVAMFCGACAGSQPSAPGVHLVAGPTQALYVTPLSVTVTGLPADGLVTLQASTVDYYDEPWKSAATFRASADGTLNLATAVPISGSYRTADADGLLWSLRPAFASSAATSFISDPAGFIVTLRVIVDRRTTAFATLTRVSSSYQVPGTVETMDYNNDFDGAVYLPEQAAPSAPVVVVIGSEEGLRGSEGIANALALTGYPALALAYFGAPRLPKCLCSVPLEYFGRAVRWLRKQPATRHRKIVLLGLGLGGQGALLIGSYAPHLVDAIVACSPFAKILGAFGETGPAWTLHGRALPNGELIPVGDIRVPLLLGDSDQGLPYDSAVSAALIMGELLRSRDTAPYTNLYYPGVGLGYIGQPPYIPLVGDFGTGGSLQANALAAEQFWTQMIRFLNDPDVTNLSTQR